MLFKFLHIALSLEVLLLGSSLFVKAQNAEITQEECVLESITKKNGTDGSSNFESDCGKSVMEIDGDGNTGEEAVITEATSPSNNTVPAPKASQGLGSDIGLPQVLDPGYSDLIFARIEKAREYFHSRVMVEDLYKDVRSICRNEHGSCAFWSVLGECDNNPAYMHVKCAPVCETCEVRNFLRTLLFWMADYEYHDPWRAHRCFVRFIKYT